MKTRIFFMLTLLVSPTILGEIEKVCLIIDERDTTNPKHPNIATEVEDFTKSYTVSHGKKFCFDLSKNYYMQYFLWETSHTIVYGTKCLYEPKKEDDGKVLLYEGESGGTPCPVQEEFAKDR
jgi:hypothetical protein